MAMGDTTPLARAVTAVAVCFLVAWSLTPPAAASAQSPPALLYSTFLGGNSSDPVADVAVAQDGGIIGVGGTSSMDFGLGLPGIRQTGGAPDAFVAKLSSDGATVEWVAVLGGSKTDSFYTVSIARNGDILAAGHSASTDFPMTDGAFSTNSNNSTEPGGVGKVVIVRLTSNGTDLVFSTYFGGGVVDWVRGIEERGDGAIVVAGATTSRSFPTTPGAFDNTTNPEVPRFVGDLYTPFDSYVAALTADGSGLVFSTLVGGWHNDHITDVVAGPGLNVTVVGFTESDDFPFTPQATALRAPSGQWTGVWAFVARLNETGGGLVYAGTVDASRSLWAYGLALDAEGGVYVAGQGYSLNTTAGAFNTTSMEYANQTWVAHFDPDATEMTAATWLGPRGNIRSLTLTTGRGVAVGLSTYAPSFPVTVANGSSASQKHDGYVGVLSCGLETLLAWTYLGGSEDDIVLGTAAARNGSLVVGGSTRSTDFPLTAGAADTSMVPAGDWPYGNDEGFVSIVDVPNATGPWASVVPNATVGTVIAHSRWTRRPRASFAVHPRTWSTGGTSTATASRTPAGQTRQTPSTPTARRACTR